MLTKEAYDCHVHETPHTALVQLEALSKNAVLQSYRLISRFSTFKHIDEKKEGSQLDILKLTSNQLFQYSLILFSFSRLGPCQCTRA
jgi:hypothetical protein